MKSRGKRAKVALQGTGMAKMNSSNYPCLRNGTRLPCNYHCKKCYFEIVYCHRS